MILRRVIAHVRKQEWTAIGIDFVIVVLGVFVGIQVSNWNAAHVEAAKQEVYLERLHNDFQGIRARLELHVEHYDRAIDGGDFMLSLIAPGDSETMVESIDHARLQSGLDALTSPRVPPGAPPTYLEMVSEGQLSGVYPLELRDKLAEYDRLQSVVQEVSRVVNERSIQQIPALYHHVTMLAVPDPTALSGVRSDLLSYDLEGMRSDRDFAVAIIILREDALNSLGQRRFQLQLIDEILGLIEMELES